MIAKGVFNYAKSKYKEIYEIVLEELSNINVSDKVENKNGLSYLRDDKNGQFKKKHGMRNTKIYNVWCGMKSRCYNANNKSYKNYGNR